MYVGVHGHLNPITIKTMNAMMRFQGEPAEETEKDCITDLGTPVCIVLASLLEIVVPLVFCGVAYRTIFFIHEKIQ